MIKLSPPSLNGSISVEAAINRRRSIRSYSKNPVSLQDLGQLLWAGQGITGKGWLRAAPSAGALYPLELYLAAGSIKDLDPGIYHYIAEQHGLEQIVPGDKRDALAASALGQGIVAAAPLCLVIGAVYQRTAVKYGSRARRYVDMEAGLAAQNILLQAAALQLGSVIVGAFNDMAIKEILLMPMDHEPLTLIPIGHPPYKEH